MTEQIEIRSYNEIIDELFFGKEAALEKLAKVRHTEYNVRLWRKGIRGVDKKMIKYFEERFLGEGIKLQTATKEQFSAALKSLNYAIGGDNLKKSPTGCYKRCFNLVEEMNRAIVDEGLGKPVKIDDFIDFYTFDHSEPVYEKPSFEKIYPVFFDSKNRREFRETINYLKKSKRKASPANIIRMIRRAKELSLKD